MHEAFFLRDPGCSQSLKNLAGRVFSSLALEFVEERESSNYVEGHYFLGHAANVSVEVCHSDGSVMPEYPFWVTIESPTLRRGATAQLETRPETIASMLASSGFEVFIPSVGWGKVGWILNGKVFSA